MVEHNPPPHADRVPLIPLPIALYISDGLVFELYDGGQPHRRFSIRWETLVPTKESEPEVASESPRTVSGIHKEQCRRELPLNQRPPCSAFNPIVNSLEMRMAMRIRVTTRADLYEKRKQEHIERGYRIEDERPIAVNGLCSFIAVREMTASDPVDELVARALNDKHSSANGDRH